MQNISLWSSGMRRKQNFEVAFTFRFLSLSLFSFFLPHFFFFSWALILVGFILVGKVFRKAFRILGLDERKGRWVVKQDFHGKFWVNVTWFFAFFSGFLDWVVLILVWFERSLHSAYVSRQSYPWPSKLMMSQSVEGTWICMSSSGANGLIFMRHVTALLPLNARIKGKNKTCSGKVYGTPFTMMQNLRARKKRRKTFVAQANTGVTFQSIMSSWVTSDLSTLYFKLMTFRIQSKGFIA